mgnify:CR=1 FL=1
MSMSVNTKGVIVRSIYLLFALTFCRVLNMSNGGESPHFDPRLALISEF